MTDLFANLESILKNLILLFYVVEGNQSLTTLRNTAMKNLFYKFNEKHFLWVSIYKIFKKLYTISWCLPCFDAIVSMRNQLTNTYVSLKSWYNKVANSM